MTSPDSLAAPAPAPRTRSHLSLFATVFAAMALLLTACGFGDETDNADATTDSAARRVENSVDIDTSGVVYDGFCAVWAEVAPTVVGGPAATGAASIDQYLDWMVDGFGRLVVAAEATSGFPAFALTDLNDYHEDFIVAAASETGPGAGDAALRDRVEAFLDAYCDGSDTVDDTSTTPDDETVPADDETATGGNCGSFQFFLSVEAAEGLGIDHVALSSHYLQALDDVTAGIDPGPTFDVSDLSPPVAYEAVGCEGAQAIQQLFVDGGYGTAIEGAELGS